MPQVFIDGSNLSSHPFLNFHLEIGVRMELPINSLLLVVAEMYRGECIVTKSIE